jgi:hypothetical protein
MLEMLPNLSVQHKLEDLWIHKIIDLERFA